MAGAHVFAHVLTAGLIARRKGDRDGTVVEAGDSLWALGPLQGGNLELTPAARGCDLLVVRLDVRG